VQGVKWYIPMLKSRMLICRIGSPATIVLARGCNRMKMIPTNPFGRTNMQGYELAGYCGVDSGQILITDPCYIDSGWNHRDDSSPLNIDYNDDPPSKKRPFSYEGACNATLSEFKAGQLDEGVTGVAVSSGYGDGNYPVFVKKNKEGRIIEARILFDWDEDEQL